MKWKYAYPHINTRIMLPRRMARSKPLKSVRWEKKGIGSRSNTGITMWLHSMVLKATVSTITIPVAADMPPIKTNNANKGCCSTIGSLKTNVSASTLPSGNCSIPENATGKTNKLMARRYNGKSQIALFKCSSLTFSTTAT